MAHSQAKKQGKPYLFLFFVGKVTIAFVLHLTSRNISCHGTLEFARKFSAGRLLQADQHAVQILRHL
ncbi:hypothetical protein HMPREF3152_06530 [Actinomyces sp. HMSC06A08]|nr:hypothetical protein HMPREF2835_01230 [Actinomyces sp. HMSC072A03]OFT55354.1 hypothetical protein HMPREF3152_06530 [Actinomyces sp. HMSC06A08]